MSKVLVIGAGPNGLTCATRLSLEGHEVTIYEGQKSVGGAARSAPLFLGSQAIADLGASSHPFGVLSPAFEALGLESKGLSWAHPKVALAHPLDNGDAGVLFSGDLKRTVDGLGNDARAWELLHEPVLSRPEEVVDGVLRPMLSLPPHPFLHSRFGARGVVNAAAISRALFSTEKAKALFAGSSLHSFLPLNKPLTGAFGIIFGGLASSSGWPFAVSGSQGIIDALVDIFIASGGTIVDDFFVDDLRVLESADAIVFDLGPRQVARLTEGLIPARLTKRLFNWRYGPSVFKVDFLLKNAVPWKNELVSDAGTVHLGGSMSEVAAAETAVHGGNLSDNPFVLLCQPSIVDSVSRNHGDRHVVWCYAHVPLGYDGDFLLPILSQIERFAPGFRDSIECLEVTTAADLERWNPNLVHGDISGGSVSGMQQVFRPLVSLCPYRLGRSSFYMCSASTPPGAGVHGMNGWHAASVVLRNLD